MYSYSAGMSGDSAAMSRGSCGEGSGRVIIRGGILGRSSYERNKVRGSVAVQVGGVVYADWRAGAVGVDPGIVQGRGAAGRGDCATHRLFLDADLEASGGAQEIRDGRDLLRPALSNRAGVPAEAGRDDTGPRALHSEARYAAVSRVSAGGRAHHQDTKLRPWCLRVLVVKFFQALEKKR